MNHFKRLLLILWAGLLVSGCMPPSLVLTAEPSPTATAQPTGTTAAPTATATAVPDGTSTPAGAWIRPQPASGAPGDLVQVQGFLPGGLSQATLAQENYLTHATICWNGCKTGLLEDGLEVHWSRTEPGRFEMQYTVPGAPWLSSDGVHLLDAGDYRLDLIYLDPSKYGCNSPDGCEVISTASASFHLTQSAPHPDCTEKQCGSLILDPGKAGPGEAVQVQGWAPLLEIIGTPMGYNLVIVSNETNHAGQIMGSFPIQQALDGSLSGSFQVPQIGYYGLPLAAGTYTLALQAGKLNTAKGSPPVLVNSTPFEISAAAGWVEHDHPKPLWIQPSADITNSTLATDPLHPERMAYCTPGNIVLTEDAGKTWLTFPTTDVTQLSPDSAVALGDTSRLPLCSAVTLDPTHPDSLYATFMLASKAYGPPPSYYVGYYTTDHGETWQLAPVPAIRTAGEQIVGLFGGFWNSGSAVEALYYQTSDSPSAPWGMQAKATSDGGLTWSPAPLTCPPSGPCLRWDAGPSMAGGMGADMPQRVMLSTDHGQFWQKTGQEVQLRMDGPHELVALSDKAAVLLSGANSFPLRYTADGGQTWQSLALPDLPAKGSGQTMGYTGLQMLADGRLLAKRPDDGHWVALMPGAKDWCEVHFTSASASPVFFHVVGNQVWWLDNAFTQAKSAALNQLSCR